MNNTDNIMISWTFDLARTIEIVDFFIKNTSKEYISHGEIQCGRAIDSENWSPNLKEVLTSEFNYCIGRSQVLEKENVAIAEIDNELVGVMLVEHFSEGGSPYVVLHDIVVSSAHRGNGIGRIMLHWLEEEMKKKNIRQIFAESGLHNERAHNFFERHGFHTTSIVIQKIF